MKMLKTEINPSEIINYSDVRTIEPFILKGIEGHCLPGYGLLKGTKFTDDYGDERKANEDTVIFFRNGAWVIRYSEEINSVIDGIEMDYPVSYETEDFEILN